MKKSSLLNNLLLYSPHLGILSLSTKYILPYDRAQCRSGFERWAKKITEAWQTPCPCLWSVELAAANVHIRQWKSHLPSAISIS